MGVVARAKGMSEIARGASVSREHLYRALKEIGNPEFSTVVRVLKALGLRLSAQPVVEEKRKRRTKAAKKAA